MSVPHPPSLKLPGIHAYPLLQLKYENDASGLGLLGQAPSSWSLDDFEFRKANFHLPSRVGLVQIAALENLSDTTFSCLCRALEPTYDGLSVLNRGDLQSIALSQEPEINEFEAERGHATLAQIESFLMSETLASPYINWGQIAELYNTSDFAQQGALLDYFRIILNRDLAGLFNIQEPLLSLPAVLEETFETREIAGDLYVADHVNQALVKDFVFMNQYRVTMPNQDDSECLMFAAATLQMAMAKGVAWLKNPANAHQSKMQIWNEDNLIAGGQRHGTDSLSLVDATVLWHPAEEVDKDTFNATVKTVERAFESEKLARSSDTGIETDVDSPVIWTKSTTFRAPTAEDICANWIKKQEAGPFGLDPLVKAFLQSNPDYVPGISTFGSRQLPTKAKWEKISRIMVEANRSRDDDSPYLYPRDMFLSDFTPRLVREFKQFSRDQGYELLPVPGRGHEIEGGPAL